MFENPPLPACQMEKALHVSAELRCSCRIFPSDGFLHRLETVCPPRPEEGQLRPIQGSAKVSSLRNRSSFLLHCQEAKPALRQF